MEEVVGSRYAKSSVLGSHREKGGSKLEEMMMCAQTHSSECVCVCVCMYIKTLVYSLCNIYMGFPGGLNGKESTCNARDLGSIPLHTYVYKYKTLVSKVKKKIIYIYIYIYICVCEC